MDLMRQVFRTLAYIVAFGVMFQAAVMVYAIAGLGLYIERGGVIDAAAMEQSAAGQPAFAEEIGFMLHGMNGMMVMPALALLLLIASFFAHVRGAWKWGLAVLLLVVLQITLGIFGHSVPFLGALHGLNALILFSVALYTGWRVAARGRSTRTAGETSPGDRTTATPAAPAGA
jgi:heme A synthase